MLPGGAYREPEQVQRLVKRIGGEQLFERAKPA